MMIDIVVYYYKCTYESRKKTPRKKKFPGKKSLKKKEPKIIPFYIKQTLKNEKNIIQ